MENNTTKDAAMKYLESLDEKSAWVFTKQETDFTTAINATRLFAEIPEADKTNVEEYFAAYHVEYDVETDRHRMLVIPQLLGLITKTPFYERGVQYNKERPTAVFDAMKNLPDGKKLNTLKTEQILKLKIHAIIDTANNNEGYKILPVIFIYKVLKELQKYNIRVVRLDQLWTYVMTCRNYSDWANAVRFIKAGAPASEYVPLYKSNSRVLTLIKKNINLFNFDVDTIAINPDFDEYFDRNFMQKYNIDEMFETLNREVDYSYFLYNEQGFGVNLVDKPEGFESKNVVMDDNADDGKNEDDDYEGKVNDLDEDNINKDVAIGAHGVAPSISVSAKSSKKYRRNPLLGKIAIQNAYYCCEKDPRHETFVSARTGKNFMEAHHLVPVQRQAEIWEKYGVNVDCVENILSLCPTCHRAIHNGSREVRREMVTDLYQKLYPRYKSIGFEISLDEVLKIYKV